MANSTSDILSLDSLQIGYSKGKKRKILLPPLNCSAVKGELIAVIGRNGIGKSTLLRTLAGLQPQLDGNIFINGKCIWHYSRIELAKNIGYISTEVIKVNNMSVYDLVALGRFPHTNWLGQIDEENHQAILDAIAKTGMLSLAGRFISELSDGERQKAMISRIIAQDAGIMIMDEPTAFLDIGSKYEILNLLNRLSQKDNKTIIFSTHDLHLALNHSDKIWLVLDDKLLYGSPEDLMIGNVFDHLFDAGSLKFNSENGTFSCKNSGNRLIFIEGMGKLRYWTEKAVSRKGFSISETITEPYIRIPQGESRNWQLIAQKSVDEFSSIYDLIRKIDRYIIQPI